MMPFSPSSLTTAQITKLLHEGGLCALPTETVYGLAANGYDDKAVARIFEMKGRPTFNPLILHYATLGALLEDVLWPAQAQELAEAFWPGPLTLVLKRSPGCRVSRLASAGLDTLAVRLPAHPMMQAVLASVDFPLAAPSANPSGALSPTHASHVSRVFPGLPVLDGGECLWGLESTVLDLTGPSPRLLRPGAVSLDQLSPWHPMPPPCSAGTIETAFYSPGLLPAHYAPQKPLRLGAYTVGAEEGLLAFGPTPPKGALVTLNLSPSGDLREAASHFFDFLHQLEVHPCASIAVMNIPKEGLGLALNDRLTRAAQGAPHGPT